MRTHTDSGLTDNAWVRRIGELRQMVADSYDPATATAEEWTDWFVDSCDEEFGDDEIRILAREAQSYEAEWNADH